MILLKIVAGIMFAVVLYMVYKDFKGNMRG